MYLPISLGYNCYVKRYIDTIWSGETNLFDWIGTSMWGILMLFQEDFKDAFERDFYSFVKITTERRPILTHNKYYIRVLHDEMDTYTQKYLRRLERLKTILNTANDNSDIHLLFIRLEESQYARIMYENYAEYYRHDELHYIKLLTEFLVTNYPKLQFTFAYIRPDTGTGTRSSIHDYLGHRIVEINTDIEITWINCREKLAEILKDIIPERA